MNSKTIWKRDISISELVSFLSSRTLIILGIGVLVALMTGVFTRLFITPKYQSYITMYVYTNPESTQMGSINNSDLLAAENLAGTYEIILQSNQLSDAIAKEVNENLKTNDLSGSDLSKYVQVSTIEGTQLLKIMATTSDPKRSAVIANAYAEIAPDEIVRVTKAGGVEIVDYAEVPQRQSSPNFMMNCIKGFFAGLILAVVIFLIRMLRDTGLYTEEDVSKISSLAVIGTIPDISVQQETAAEDKLWKIKKVRVISNAKE